MPRAPRVFVEGGLYHVYNRVSRGEAPFVEEAEAEGLLGILAEAKERDGLTVLAWCIMPNHFHLAVRTTTVPLWRAMASIQTRCARRVNRQRQVLGPLWQSRYKAKLVEDPRYLAQVVLYIHLNPVAAGLVTKPADYRWSGHSEVLRRSRRPLLDVDETLLVFGAKRGEARRSYLGAMTAGDGGRWSGLGPGRLPWWQYGRQASGDDEELEVATGRPYVDEQGRSTGLERPHLTAAELVTRVGGLLGVGVEALGSRGKDADTVRARELVVTLGVERYGLRVRDLASAIGARYDTVSLWGRRGARRRSADAGFRRRLDEIDAVLAGSPSQ